MSGTHNWVTIVATNIPYCIRRSDRPGFWFHRRCPLDCQEALGIKAWRKYAGATPSQARLKVAAFLAETEDLINSVRNPKALNGSVRRLTHEEDLRLLQGRPDLLQELVEHSAALPDNPEALAQLEPIGSLTSITAEDLIELGVRIKRPADQTVDAWRSALNELETVTRISQLNLLTKDDATAYRDNLLQRGLKVSTIKLRTAYLSGLFGLAEEEGLIPSNPFNGITKRLRPDRGTKKEYDIRQCDAKALSLSPLQQDVYTLLRYTGCRLAEILGLKPQTDFDLENNVIRITPHSDRSLKTPESERVIPIHPCIEETVRRLSKEERPFIQFHKGNRWGAGIIWSTTVGINPHGLRHHFTSVLRKEGVSELVLSKLLGHKPAGMTSHYGDVGLESLVEAVRRLY